MEIDAQTTLPSLKSKQTRAWAACWLSFRFEMIYCNSNIRDEGSLRKFTLYGFIFGYPILKTLVCRLELDKTMKQLYRLMHTAIPALKLLHNYTAFIKTQTNRSYKVWNYLSLLCLWTWTWRCLLTSTGHFRELDGLRNMRRVYNQFYLNKWINTNIITFIVI